MYCAEAQCDVMRSALLTREAHITDEVNITPEGHITFRVSGTHRSKKPNACALGFFVAGMAGFEPTNARVKVWCLTAWRHPIMSHICDTNSIIAYFFGAVKRKYNFPSVFPSTNQEPPGIRDSQRLCFYFVPKSRSPASPRPGRIYPWSLS